MPKKRTFLTLAITAAVWASIAHGGDFNACRVTYDYDGSLLINGERFFPAGCYFIPPGEPDQTPAPPIDIAYQTYAANGGNLLIGPRYFNMYNTSDVYGVHGLPSGLFYGEYECVQHLDAANPYGVKLMTDPHIFWWWDESYPGGGGIHPIWADVSGYWGWPIEQTLQEDRFSGLGPSNGIKGWVENGASEAFMGWNHWHEATWAFWQSRYDNLPRQYPQSPDPEPPAEDLQQSRGWLRALEEEPPVNAEHTSLFLDPHVVRLQDLWPAYFEAVDIPAVNPICVPEPHFLYHSDNEPGSWTRESWLPNYYCASTGDAIDVVFETVDAEKPVICVVQNHWVDLDPSWVPPHTGAEPNEGQYRFMTYDGVIHRANGIIYGMQSFGTIWRDDGRWDVFEKYWEPCKPSLNEIGQGGLMHDVLKGEYDNILVEVKTVRQGNDIETSAFIGGELAPKNHFLSDQILMEGCAKKFGADTYLIVACREGIDQFSTVPPDPYEVTFRPYFSSKTLWTGTVEVVGEPDPFGPGPRTINIVDGAFTDEFVPEAVHIYKFARPAAYGAEG